MKNMKPNLRVAIAQQAMYWTAAENTERIKAALAVAAEQGASVCVFPELALTGFHRGIREQAVPDVVEPALDTIAAQLQADAVDLVFWPSLVGNPPGTVHPAQADTDDLGYFKRAALMAQRLEAFVLQSNWPMALNTPESTYLGESKAYAPDGEILLTLPRDEAGVGVFNLGEREYHWTPLPA